jgi:hypothetical protein
MSFNVVAGVSMPFQPGWGPVKYVKIRSGSRTAPIMQEADRIITITIDLEGGSFG